MITLTERAKKIFDNSLDEATDATLELWRQYVDQFIEEKGGPGSGHFGHAGRPGKVGGSKPFKSNPVTADEVPDTIRTPMHNVDLWLVGEDYDTGERKLVTAKGEQGWHHGNLAKARNVWISDTWPRGLMFLYDKDKPIILLYDFNTSFAPQEDLVRETLDVYDDILDQLEWTGRRPLLMVSYDAGATARKLRLEVFKQLPIDDAAKRRLFEVRLSVFYDQSDALSEQLYTGALDIGSWEVEMRTLIKEMYTSASAIGKGGWDAMTFQDWGRLGTPVREQYKYLRGFAADIADRADEVTLAYIRARARMYGNSAGYVAELMQAPTDLLEHLPWLPKDGSTECLVNCKCFWELKVIKTKKTLKTVRATWRLQPAEHCEDCVGRNGHVEVFDVHRDTKVPAILGGF
jgi:hypothetical protein